MVASAKLYVHLWLDFECVMQAICCLCLCRYFDFCAAHLVSLIYCSEYVGITKSAIVESIVVLVLIVVGEEKVWYRSIQGWVLNEVCIQVGQVCIYLLAYSYSVKGGDIFLVRLAHGLIKLKAAYLRVPLGWGYCLEEIWVLLENPCIFDRACLV